MADDGLTDFEHSTFTHAGKERRVFRLGTGPAVIVLAEMPGITPEVAAFARRVAAIGCTAVVPHLFGVPGRDPYARGRVALGIDMARSIVPACISREFTVWATGRTSPVVSWLRALAAREHQLCGGPGVGAVGMCFTGGFALAMAVEPVVVAPVLSQPSLPLVIGRRPRAAASIDCDPDELDVVAGRCAAEGLTVLGLRFEGDGLVPEDRFTFLSEQLGAGFVAVSLPDASANPDAVGSPHSVLTEHLIDAPGELTRDALDQVLDLFRTRLLGT
ncbi:dienelactone hydrolase family protein [Actinomarinicola tropica]|uniref:Dienelactone hydrolase n=1 Tax=Actinomarinicola tropica TaxID=2789776 RepID=A0A5Q2RIP1_9ACTN|nr:dienelactone hydrolase family protein [Actinomarinicola tropica]QGG94441.1 dienelactone hydrolase [Actinomarinicola tropica]